MNRRQLLISSVLSLASVSRLSAFAQSGTPEADERYLFDFADLRGVEEGVTRYAYASSFGFEAALKGDLGYVDAWGFRLRTESQADFVPLEMVTAYKEWMKAERMISLRSLDQAAVRNLGDESWGWVAEFLDPEQDEEQDEEQLYPWALLAVRKERTVQVLIGASVSGSPIRRLADVSENTLDRWPNSERRYTYAGEPAGGIWDTLPRLSDLEEGMVIDYSNDVADDF